VTPLRKNRDFVLLQLGQGLSTAGSSATAIAFGVALWSTLSPSSRNAPNLAELDDLSPAST
jgi:hypothetical protein